MRLDRYLVTNEYTFSRNKAQELIKKGAVLVNGDVVTKPSYEITNGDNIRITSNDQYVSRAAYKLKIFLEREKIDFKNKTVLDIGASSGGFTQVALEYGAKKVVAVDVGKGQLHETLRDCERIENHENTDIRKFSYPTKFDVIVSDVSFISLLYILDKIDELAKDEIILLFKPQFEVGKNVKRDKKGVVMDKEAILRARREFEKQTAKLNWKLVTSQESAIKGKEGNVEYVYRFKKNLL